MRIACLLTPMTPLNLAVMGGMERVLLDECAGMRARGHRAEAFASRVIGGDEHVHPIKDLSWRSRWLKWGYYLRFLRQTRWADLRHGHYTPILSLFSPRRSLTHFHGLAVGDLPLHRFGVFRRRYQRSWYLFCSRHVREQFMRRYPDIPAGRLFTIHNGIEPSRFKVREPDPDAGAPVIGFHGRWVEKKGIHVLLEALRILTRGGREFRALIAGGPDFPEVTATSSGMGERIVAAAREIPGVQLPGTIPYAGIPDLLSRVDIGVVPSIYEEPFGIVVLEYLASGIPVVASNVGGIPEIVDDAVGILVPPGDAEALAGAIERLLDDPDARLRMGREGRRRVEERFTLSSHLDGLEALYRLILEQRQ
jgi:glycosyltransferase involved in cell wall biosynthesis